MEYEASFGAFQNVCVILYFSTFESCTLTEQLLLYFRSISIYFSTWILGWIFVFIQSDGNSLIVLYTRYIFPPVNFITYIMYSLSVYNSGCMLLRGEIRMDRARDEKIKTRRERKTNVTIVYIGCGKMLFLSDSLCYPPYIELDLMIQYETIDWEA